VKPGEIIAGGDCGENDCPTVTNAANGMVDVQGYHQADAAAPAGEAVVRIPSSLILEAARALGE
jgi:hypothetical protein